MHYYLCHSTDNEDLYSLTKVHKYYFHETFKILMGEYYYEIPNCTRFLYLFNVS